MHYIILNILHIVQFYNNKDISNFLFILISKYIKITNLKTERSIKNSM